MADRFGGHRVLARRRRDLVARDFRLAARGSRRSFVALLADARAARPRRGSQFPLDSQPDLALDAAVGARASAVGQLQRDVRRHSPGAEREPVDHSRPSVGRALFYISGALGRAVGRGLDVGRGRRPGDFERASRQAELTSDHFDANRRAARDPRAVGAQSRSEQAVWAIVVAHFCSAISASTFCCSGCRPICIIHSAFRSRGSASYSIVPWIATFFTISFSGWLADSMIARGFSVGTVRKSMQSAGFCYRRDLAADSAGRGAFASRRQSLCSRSRPRLTGSAPLPSA